MTKKSMLTLAAAGSLYLLTACNNGTTTTENKDTVAMVKEEPNPTADTTKYGMKAPVYTMMEKVKTMRMTGDFDQDFANVMILNNQEAADISKMAVTQVKDPEIKDMAQRMVTDHTAEIADLQKFIAGHDTTSADHQQADAASHTHPDGEHHEFGDDLNTMMSTMVSKTLTGDADKDYVTLMLAQHQNAVKLSEDEIAHGHHAELKNMAKNMMADDKKEIAEFEKWLVKMK